ncbi:MAG: phenylalanine--tRNA ligase subunit beta [Candidatus Aminicenantes bacterium RBG_19FT_COMBO_59_29]|nr:MAG: phenylalanine--tRNA ligase subunit beta [Candidatus Aminicenantes bacterium RBG_19FT_COMBO_59_29]
MKISLDWLKEYLDGDISAQTAVEALERIGLMVEGREEKDGDVILEIETYSNRPDTLGHLGMARELAAALGLRLKERSWPLSELTVRTADLADVQILDPDLCPRYCGVVVEGVKVGPSPAWLQKRIESMGLHPINNVVDVTNYVLFSTSHPIHAFDLDKITGARVIIRRAKKGERLLCLDGTDLSLAPDMLVIADEAKPIAVAGVIGGQASAVTEGTKDIFVESAYFNPVSVRLTRKAANLQTDASYRFERGADISFPPQAALMAASLLTQFGGRSSREPADVFPLLPKKKEIILRHRRITELLGVEVDEAFVQKTLADLELGVELQQPGIWRVKAPSWRVDLDREADLIEEVARFYGYEKVPSVVPPLQVVAPIPDKSREKLGRVRPLLFHYGFNEVVNFSFSDADKERLLATGLEAIEIRNPISARASLLRTSILGGLLETAAWNKNRGLDAIQIFETGNIYYRDERGCRERLTLGLLSSGMREEPHWRQKSREVSFFHLKGACEALLQQLRYEPFSFEKAEHPCFEPGSGLALAYKEEKVGYLGQVAGRLTDVFDLKQTVYAAEIDLELLFGKQPKPFTYEAVAKYPAIIRDVSLLVPLDVSYQDICKAIEKVPLPILEEARLISQYFGESNPKDKKSLSFRFIYRHPQRTLLAEEVDRAEQQVLIQLRRAFGAQLREGGKIDNGTGKN